MFLSFVIVLFVSFFLPFLLSLYLAWSLDAVSNHTLFLFLIDFKALSDVEPWGATKVSEMSISGDWVFIDIYSFIITLGFNVAWFFSGYEMYPRIGSDLDFDKNTLRKKQYFFWWKILFFIIFYTFFWCWARSCDDIRK